MGGIDAPAARGRWFDIRDYGAVLGADSSAAFTAAIAAAAAGTRYGLVYVPPGDWLANSIDWINGPTIHGDEVGSSRIVYNGAGGAGTYIFRNTSSGGATPYTGFRNLTFDGWANGVSPGVCESALKYTGTTSVDWGMKFENLSFVRFGGDALDLGPAVNIHMDRLRWDSIIGYAVRISQTGASDPPRPVTIKRWTLDNNGTGAFFTAAGVSGFDSSASCLGVLIATTAVGIILVSEDARIELNRTMKAETDGRLSLFRIDTAGGGTATFQRTGVNRVDHADGLVFCYAPSAHVNVSMQDCTMPFTKILEGNGIAHDLWPYSGTPLATSRPSGQQAQGIVIDGSQILPGSSVPTSASFHLYRRGDFVLRTNPVPGSTGAGWLATGPASGVGRPSLSTPGGTVSTTATSTTVSLDTGAKLSNLPVGLNVLIAGAGDAGADLACQVTAHQISARTITVDVPAGTTVAGASCAAVGPTWTEFGDFADYGTTAPGSGTWVRGQKRWNTTPTAGSAKGWVCVSSGTPGVWEPFGAPASGVGGSGQPARTGFYVMPPTGAVGLALTVDTPRVTALNVPVDATIVELSAEVTTAATAASGGVLRAALYADDGSGFPTGTPLVDGGTISSETTGVKAWTVSVPVVAGRVHLAIVAQVAACTVRGCLGISPWALGTAGATNASGVLLSGTISGAFAAPSVSGPAQTPLAAAKITF